MANEKPKRLGNQAAARPVSRGAAARRSARAKQASSSRIGWIAVGLVVVILAVFGVVKLTSNSTGGSANDTSGRNAPLASAAVLAPVIHVPAATFDAIGAGSDPTAFVVTKNQPALTQNGLPRFIYYGAVYCPYCAIMRWSIVAALSRFGTFKDLKFTTSANSDGNIPTFSFHDSTYSSKYLVFTAYEAQDRNQAAFESVPNEVGKLFLKYDGNGSTPAKGFNPGQSSGIPFLDIANKYVSSGDSASQSAMFGNDDGPLVNGGPGVQEIADSVSNPTSPVGKAIGASSFVAEANFISAGICAVDKMQPSAVCQSKGVRAAAKALAATTPVG